MHKFNISPPIRVSDDANGTFKAVDLITFSATAPQRGNAGLNDSPPGLTGRRRAGAAWNQELLHGKQTQPSAEAIRLLSANIEAEEQRALRAGELTGWKRAAAAFKYDWEQISNRKEQQ